MPESEDRIEIDGVVGITYRTILDSLSKLPPGYLRAMSPVQYSHFVRNLAREYFTREFVYKKLGAEGLDELEAYWDMRTDETEEYLASYLHESEN